jgi:hypothetical protein
MPSFNAINYSLRPSKTIQRNLVFGGIQSLMNVIDFPRAVYVGLGSIWFSDFVAAHRQLKIRDLVSIEADQIGFQRAIFNRPYATVAVERGLSNDVLPRLVIDARFAHRPWILWLDYDQTLDEQRRDDLRWAVEHLPPNSVLVTTFSATGGPYGKPVNRPDRLRELFGGVVPDNLDKDACSEDELPKTLARLCLDFLSSLAAEMSRPGGFIPAFSIPYKDGAPMVTVGGILPSRGAAPAANAAIAGAEWPSRYGEVLEAPHLTIKEATAMQALLPADAPLTREAIRQLGFDLEDSQISVFDRYYNLYPAFAQIIA